MEEAHFFGRDKHAIEDEEEEEEREEREREGGRFFFPVGPPHHFQSGHSDEGGLDGCP